MYEQELARTKTLINSANLTELPYTISAIDLKE